MSRSPKARGTDRLHGRPVVRRTNEAAARERSGDSSGIHVWLVLMKAHQSMVRLAERSIVSLEMCISDFAVLEVLLHKGPQSVGEIGDGRFHERVHYHGATGSRARPRDAGAHERPARAWSISHLTESPHHERVRA